MKETFTEVDGKVLAVVACQSYLSLDLLLCLPQRLFFQRLLDEGVQFVAYQGEAAVHVGMVASEIDAPQTRLGVVDRRALDGIDQSVAFSQREVEACVHSWAAEDIVQ